MNYYEVKFSVSPNSTDATDLLAALAGEAGFESFETSDESLTGYIQQQLFDRELLDTLIESMPIPGITIAYTVDEAENRDWNEQWEQEGFNPIVVDNTLVIHDGRHLPTEDYSLQVEIDVRQAFGTGTHETTRIICGMLLGIPLDGCRVLDCGCGSGILGIVAMKCGAASCVGYDIDEWSVDNTRHNAVINQVDITSLLGDASILKNVEGMFDIVLANINRNILLNDMETFRQKMAQGAQLILSGFYTADIPMLTTKATELGLTLTEQCEENDWACLRLKL